MQHIRSALLSLTLVAFGWGLMGCQASSSNQGATETENTSASAAVSGTWQSLFDGEKVTGWHNPYEWGEVRVENGEIRLKADKKFFLITDKTYSDFIFEADIRVPDREANSGFMFRANVEPNKVWGYQAEVDPSDRQWAGGLYDEGRRGWLHPTKENEQSGKDFRNEHGDAFKPDQWNTYRIKAQGDSLKIWVNDELTTAYRDTEDREGHIGIQHHGEEGKVYRFRNLRVQEL